MKDEGFSIRPGRGKVVDVYDGRKWPVIGAGISLTQYCSTLHLNLKPLGPRTPPCILPAFSLTCQDQ
ncbi:hypothetical protein ElyMa_001598200 [Elysia marginata]|uniref:Uncharacterized protein n=1 Tax=Elysia marginata TaxID=1093978 RepID=A0AAV4JJH2_9GAST|nr:hypothetical protein ElyMa_001598200 [Elysia marginata]